MRKKVAVMLVIFSFFLIGEKSMAKGAGIGYLRGGARQTNGLVFWTTGKSGFGGYLDVKGKAGPSENNVYSMSTYKAEAIYGDEFLEIREGYGALNLGVCYETKPLLWLGGIGWGWSNKYSPYSGKKTT